MKRSVFILFLFITLISNAKTRYVAPATATPVGNNGNSGLITAPWLTWAYAATQAVAGDTIYFRGGVYPQSVLTGAGTNMAVNDGTYADPICYFAYPADFAAGNRPILDGSNVATVTGQHNVGILTSGGRYLYFKGLEIRTLHQYDADWLGIGVAMYLGDWTRFEQMKVHDIDGVAFYFSLDDADTTYVINCDAYDLCDSLTTSMGYPYYGGTGTGYIVAFNPGAGYAYYQGNRVWRFSDTGYGVGNISSDAGEAIYDSCWAIGGGFMMGDGVGWKFGQSGASSTDLKRTLTHNIAAYNTCPTSDGVNGAGFAENNWSSWHYNVNMHIYNNFAYKNEIGIEINAVAHTSVPTAYNWYRNNIVYESTRTNIYNSGGTYYHEYNNWDIPITVTDADFASLDTTGMSGARKTGGWLPDIIFGHLSDASQLIDRGVDVGLPYEDDAPDLGVFEYDYEEDPPPSIPLVSTVPPFNINTRQGSSGGHAISDRGAAITPLPWTQTTMTSTKSLPIELFQQVHLSTTVRLLHSRLEVRKSVLSTQNTKAMTVQMSRSDRIH